jgi:hypothetical protein
MPTQKKNKATKQVERKLGGIFSSLGSIEQLLEQVEPKEIRKMAEGASITIFPAKTRTYEFTVGSEQCFIKRDTNGDVCIQYSGIIASKKNIGHNVIIAMSGYYSC